MADDRLDQQSGDRRRDPQDRQLVDVRAERLEDAAGVDVLQAPDDLHAEQATAHVGQRHARQRHVPIVKPGRRHVRLQSPSFDALSRVSILFKRARNDQ
jgi:hypothetical protein